MWAVAAVALVACARSSRNGQEFTVQDQTAIRQKNQEFVDAFNAKQIPKILSIYADTSVFMPLRSTKRYLPRSWRDAPDAGA